MRKLIIYRQFFTDSDCYRSGKTQQPQGVQVHSTGANNPYLKRYVQPDDGRLGTNTYKNSHNRPGVDVCANAYIGKIADGTPAIYQTLPWDYRCWLSGSGSRGNANKMGYIGFEICEDNLSNEEYFQQAVMTLSVNLVAYLCLQYNIPITNVHDHRELHEMGVASNHGDILHWLKKYGLTMDDYRRAVEEAMAEGIQATYIEGDEEVWEEDEEPMSVLYTAKVVANNKYPVKMRSGPSTNDSVLAYVPLGTIVNVYSEINSTWSQIEYGGKIGYMMREFLQQQVQDDPADIKITRETLEDIKAQLEALLAIVDGLLNT